MSDRAEQLLATFSEEDREACVEHSASWYTLDGRHLPRHYEKENLLAVLYQKPCYVPDANSNWKAEAGKPENCDKAFIIGRTLTDEEFNLKGLLFGPKVDTRNDNIFLLGVDCVNNKELISIERLDQFYRATLNETSLVLESQSRHGRTDLKFLEWKARRAANVDHEKNCILMLLGVKHISELALARDCLEKRNQLLAFIQRESPKCKGNWIQAVGVVRHCYALLLIESRMIRNEFSKQNYDNVFGDALVLHNALFLQASILSCDKPLKRMASYAGIHCRNAVS